MQVKWEEKDIKVGRRYSRPNIEVWIIGYLSYEEDAGKSYVSISESDGMVTKPGTKAEVAEMLTEGRYLPVELLDT